MSSGNFVDLRITHAGTAGGDQDSVWPAFTDIMTVIVMIFLMVMLAFLIKNSQLVDQLQTTLIAKDQATQQALLSASQNTSLEDQLAKVRQRILAMESALGQANDQSDSLTLELAAKQQLAEELGIEVALLSKLRDELTAENSQILGSLELSDKKLLDFEAQSTSDKNVLNEKISILLAEKAGLLVDVEKSAQSLEQQEADRLRLTSKVISLSEQLRSLTDRLKEEEQTNQALTQENTALSTNVSDQSVLLEGLATSKEELQAKLAQIVAQLSQLQQLYDSRGQTVAELQEQVSSSTNRYKSLQEEFDSLDSQYRKLIRPARSTAGKVVVDVIYTQRGGKAVYELQTPEQSAPTAYSLAGLQARLAELKQQHGQKLYTKVRIGQNSNVGFNEAWKFTQSILSEYDYYAQDFATPKSE